MDREIEAYRSSLKSYIEAQYHISDPRLVAIRRRLLDAPGAIMQRPYLESTPRYIVSRSYVELDLPPAVSSFFGELSDAGRLFPQPYTHQAEALEATFADPPADLVVTTGTGSGKTETFLLPILARAADEASTRRQTFEQRALRALLLYPMNALVNDQLGRLRTLIGSSEVASWFTKTGGRPLKFARYTGRALYPGRRREPTVHASRLKSLRFYLDLEKKAAAGDRDARDLILKLRRRGKWPSKPPSGAVEDGMSAWFGVGPYRDRVGEWRRTVERPEDPELLLRHEAQEAVPDLLVTNYSMLEYMLLRPIERSIFADTAEFYAANPGQQLILVLDEAHLYKGAQGTEVAMLIRRLRLRLGLRPDQLQVICTSASFSGSDAAREFAAALSGKPTAGFIVLSGEKRAVSPSGRGVAALAATLVECDVSTLLASPNLGTRLEAIRPLLEAAGGDLTAGQLWLRGSGSSATLHGLDADLAPVAVEVALADDWRLVPTPPLVLEKLKGADGIELSLDGENCAARVRGGELRATPGYDPLQSVVFAALTAQPVVGRLVNLTSGAPSEEDEGLVGGPHGSAQEVRSLAGRLFPAVDPALAVEATNNLIELASFAKELPEAAPILPARVHAFFRGLPGLWACIDPNCAELPSELQGGPTGALHAQPARTCGCGARVFELFTCRACGSAFLRAFALDPRNPEHLWPEDVGEVDELDHGVAPIFISLAEPRDPERRRWAELDLHTGKIYEGGAPAEAEVRDVWLPMANESFGSAGPGTFQSCPRCRAADRRYPIQDHSTSGDEPFQEIVTSQLLEQPPRQAVQTALRGRKALIFSDGRQAASKLAGKLQQYSLRDSVRPLLLDGIQRLEGQFGERFALSDSYLALLTACIANGVHLRPAETPHFDEDLVQLLQLWDPAGGAFKAAVELRHIRARSAQLNQRVNKELLGAVYPVLTDPHTGVRALALARIEPLLDDMEAEALASLEAPPIEGVDEPREALLQAWLELMFGRRSLLLPTTPPEWKGTDSGPKVAFNKGAFKARLEPLVGRAFFRDQLTHPRGQPRRRWLQFLYQTFGQDDGPDGFLLRSQKVHLVRSDVSWARCARCTGAQPGGGLFGDRCALKWGSRTCGGEVHRLDPLTDEVFRTRKGHYRRLVERLEAGEDGYAPHPYVAAEHSAALNPADASAAMGVAEWHELRFQDLDVEGPDGRKAGPVDVLSCTTTMEVGIDIGSLTAVAMRNVPPGRANYQQRAGRAGRRGSSLSTVITYCDSDSHDQRFFERPAEMISGPVPDPSLNLDNPVIVRRHANAQVISMYQQDAVPDLVAGAVGAASSVFESLGTLRHFRTGSPDSFSYLGLVRWLDHNRPRVDRALSALVPGEVPERDDLIRSVGDDLLAELREAGAGPMDPAEAALAPNQADIAREDQSAEGFLDLEDDDGVLDWDDADGLADEGGAAGAQGEPAPEINSPHDAKKLLDRLFDHGVLPRYAFPTDVAAFNVFSASRSDDWRAVLEYAPQRGLNQALSSYAPGREVWVNGKRYYSFALWTPFARDRWLAYRRQRLYSECQVCGYAVVKERSSDHWVDKREQCPACRTPGALGPATRWIRPPGFAHPVELPPGLALVDRPRATRATRAKLKARFGDPGSARHRHEVSDGGPGYTIWSSSEPLVMTNSGSTDPRRGGFLYCPLCGRTEPNAWPEGRLGGAHPKPFPNHRGEPGCDGRPVTLVLGNEFRTDIALFRFDLGPEVRLPPGAATTKVVLTTLATALSTAAAALLDVDPDDVRGEYRVAMSEAGRIGREVDVFLYDLAAGGAGFVRAAVDRHPDLLAKAREILSGCTCTHSCYRCLRSYQNRFEHANLHRKLALSMLDLCETGAPPSLDTDDEDRLLRELRVELADAGHDARLGVGQITVSDLGGLVVVVAHPLRPGTPGSTRATAAAAAAPRSVEVSHLVIERALPLAVEQVRNPAAAVAGPPPVELPGWLERSNDGVPVYRCEEAVKEADGAPLGHVVIPGAPEGALLVHLDADTMEELRAGERRPLTRGAWMVLTPTAAGDFDRRSYQLIATGRPSGATGVNWTFGKPQLRLSATPPVVKVVYSSKRRECRPEAFLVEDTRSVGRVWAVYVDQKLKRMGR